MQSCNLVVDSCCDLPSELLQADGLYLLKFPYVMDGGSFYDDLFQTRDPHDFYEAMRKGSGPTTSQVPMVDFLELFRTLAETGRPSVYLSFSSGLSGSFDAAQLALAQLKEEGLEPEIYLVDTHLASIAEGLLVHEAIHQWKRGMGAADLAVWAEEARCFENEMFMVEDLDTLRRGGRIPSSVAVAGTALDVKPLLSIDKDGRLAVTGVARGRKKGMKALVDNLVKRKNEDNQISTVLIGHADCPKDAHKLKEMVLKADETVIPIICNIGPVIGSHVGPGMLALCFWGQDKRENLSLADKIARKVKGGRE